MDSVRSIDPGHLRACMSMLVLFNGLQSDNASGTGRYAFELARWLPRISDDLELAFLWPENAPTPEGALDGFIPCKGTAGGRLVADQFRVPREARRLGADCIHYPATIGPLRVVGPTVLTVHDLSFVHHPSWFRWSRAVYYNWGLRRSARFTGRFIADSESTATELCRYMSLSSEVVDVVHLGIDEGFSKAGSQRQQELRTRLNLPDHFFLYVGTIEPRKNIVRIVEAWNSIAASCPWDLVIAGRDGWKTKSVYRAIERCEHRNRIHTMGFVANDDLCALLSTADALVWPSLWEGFGLPPLEAMACETPVLSSNVSSLPEVIGEAGLLVDPHSVDDISRGMLRLAKDEKLRDRLQKMGLKRARAFSWKRTAQGVLESYHKALEGESLAHR